MMRRHTYAAAERFILSREFFGMKLGLENITRFLETLGQPQRRYDTIHIAGTNGKGSCAALLASVLTAAGYRVGLFTSPHLMDLRERIRIDGEMIPRRAVTGFIDRHRPALAKKKLSFFELLTTLAFDHFARQEVDVAVIETGLGGRLDGTNVLAPCLTMVTDIGLDHAEILGKSLSKIAREKAGIIKPDVPHLIGLLPDRARRVMRDTCRKRGAPLLSLSKHDFSLDPTGRKLDFQNNGLRFIGLSPPLAGRHQLRNCALVLKAVSLLRQEGFAISKAAVSRGVSATSWPGRFQILPNGSAAPMVVLDVCHNAGGAAAFADTFAQMFPGRRGEVLLGFVKRKQHQAIVDALVPVAKRFWLVPLPTKRTCDVKDLAERLNWRGIPVTLSGRLQTARNRLLKLAAPDDIISVIGSHFLVGEYLEKHGCK